MKQVMIVFEIPDDEIIDQSVVPKLSHCRIKEETKADMICSTPVRIIDNQEIVGQVVSILSAYNIDWKAKAFREEVL